MCLGVLKSQSFRLESVLGEAYSYNLIRSADGTQVAWVVNEKGIRSLYTHDVLKDTSILRLKTTSDDGQEIGNLKFDFSGRSIYYNMGGATNKDGDSPNPASLSDYPRRKLFRMDLTTYEIDTIGVFGTYEISPDDTYILLSAGKEIIKWTVEDKLTKSILKMRGTVSNLAINPLGGEISFVSNRNDHSFVGIYSYDSDRIQWIDPGIYFDDHPQWSPDGSFVAFIRSPGYGKDDLPNITGANPFSIVVHDKHLSMTNSIWDSPGDDGGFAQYYPEHPLRWAKSNQILFYSEHEDWMKMYAISPSGDNLRVLIEGECEIEQSDLSPDGIIVLFSANCNDIDRRDIFSYDLQKDHLKPLIRGTEIETDPIGLVNELVYFRRASHNFPTRISKIVQGRVSDIYPVTLSEEFPKKDLVQPEQHVFYSDDGIKVYGQLFVRGKDSNRKKPAVLFMHGGPIRQMLLGWHYSSYYAGTYIMNQYLASQGYVVMSVNYRSGIGYGRDFRRAENQGPRGASEYEDIYSAAIYLQSLPYVDQNRIGLWGGSYGGLLTAQGLANDSDIFKAGVDFHGVHDWAWRARDFSKGGFWGITEDLMPLAYESSPSANLEDWTSPVLFIHGDDDRNVMFGQTIDLANRLKKQKVYHEIFILPDEVHGFLRYESWLQSFKRTLSFFNQQLKNK